MCDIPRWKSPFSGKWHGYNPRATGKFVKSMLPAIASIELTGSFNSYCSREREIHVALAVAKY